jgi:hypothetical protein
MSELLKQGERAKANDYFRAFLEVHDAKCPICSPSEASAEQHDESKPPTRKAALSTIAWGFVWLIGAVWFVTSIQLTPVDDFRLLLSAKTASGQIVEALAGC